jgi:ectoine hydroxylase-related dioxygenase (phytanoyl-CoA dioxygenase family)
MERSDVADAVAHWHDHGYAVLERFLDPGELAAAQAELPALYPTADEFHDDADPDRNARFRRGVFDGIDRFPFEGVELNLLAVHLRIVELAETLLGERDLRLYGAEAWAKYTGACDYGQALHRDYLNHTPLVPSPDPRFRQLEMFLLLSDVTADHGPTHVVSRTRTATMPAMPNWYGPDERPDLYEVEVPASGPAGTVLLYATDTFHRGTDMRAARAARFTLQMHFRPGEVEWGQRRGWANAAHNRNWTAFVERASARQLELFGFPPPGHPYWCDETLTGVGQRYPDLDLTPWRS